MMALINATFAMLEDIGLARTQSIFSRVWLGRSDSYYAYLKSSRTVPSLGCLIYLSERLTELCSARYEILSMNRDDLARTRALSEMSVKILCAVLNSAKARRLRSR
jgi:hypothetical protein